ncbi:MAG TPA: shikimate kinase [Acidimicrobiales bacterium]|nr:shikimate kinase [Acidimicrobiales bacterium]
MTARILLVGMMGAGKTTVGRLVAATLGWDYLDSDVEVQQATGMTVPEIFSTRGEAAFRAAETDALRLACASDRPVVVSVAGGAVLRPENRLLMQASGVVVWLRARLETLVARVGDGQGRPLLEGDPRATLESLSLVRDPLYAEVADDTVDVDDLGAEQVASRVVELVAGRA